MGNLLASNRRLAVDYQNEPDWLVTDSAIPATPANILAAAETANLLENESFDTATTYDALNDDLPPKRGGTAAASRSASADARSQRQCMIGSCPRSDAMNQKPLMRGSRLLDLRARRLENGYLEVMIATNAGNFALGRDHVTSLSDSNPSDRLESRLPSAYSDASIQEVWTDGDSLFVLLDGDRCIVYEYVLPDATGVMEGLSFVDDRATVERVRKDLEQDLDARRVP